MMCNWCGILQPCNCSNSWASSTGRRTGVKKTVFRAMAMSLGTARPRSFARLARPSSTPASHHPLLLCFRRKVYSMELFGLASNNDHFLSGQAQSAATSRGRARRIGFSRGRPSFDHRGCRLWEDQHPCPSRCSSHRQWRRSASYHAADLLATRCRGDDSTC